MPKTFEEPFEEYDEQLYKDIERAMKGKSEEEKMDLIMNLSVLLPYTEQTQWQAVRNYMMGYMFPMNDDGGLDTALMEERLEQMEKRRIERVYEPAGKFALENKQQHSEKWIWDQLNNKQESGLLQVGYMFEILGGRFNNMDFDQFMVSTYPQRHAEMGLDIYAKMAEEKREKLLQQMPEEKRKCVLEGIRYWKNRSDLKNDYTKEENAVQKEMEKNDHLLDSTESGKVYGRSHYEYCRDMDLSFITNKDTYKEIQRTMLSIAKKEQIDPEWVSERPQDRTMDELAETLEGLSRELNDVSGYRWRDSREFNRIKDDLVSLQEDLKKGNSRENREKLMESLAQFSKDCKAYQEKNPGVRRTERGNQRKEVVGKLQAMIDDQLQKVMGPEMNEEMRKEADRQYQKAVREEAKESLKREKVDSRAFLNEGRKTISSRPVTSEKKAPEAGRKSVEPERK